MPATMFESKSGAVPTIIAARSKVTSSTTQTTAIVDSNSTRGMRVKPGFHCTRLPREAMFVALPRNGDTMLPRANLARVEPNRSGSLSRGKGISVCCALSVETVLWRRSTAARGCRVSILDTNTVINT
jgi:hypothetical protein